LAIYWDFILSIAKSLTADIHGILVPCSP
jgi:hypothetical protein